MNVLINVCLNGLYRSCLEQNVDSGKQTTTYHITKRLDNLTYTACKLEYSPL